MATERAPERVDRQKIAALLAADRYADAIELMDRSGGEAAVRSNALMFIDPDFADAAVERYPNSPAILYTAAQGRLRPEDKRLAELERVLELEPNHADAASLKSLLLLGQGDRAGAKQALETLDETASKTLAVAKARAAISGADGHHRDAVDALLETGSRGRPRSRARDSRHGLR